MTRHPARKYSFIELVQNLEERVTLKRIRKNTNDAGLSLYTYAESTVYDKAWDDFTIMARGLILDHNESRVVATPFPKFFNYMENGATLPDLPFETHEKLDGSLGIVYNHNLKWHVATKGSLNSTQAQWGTAKIRQLNTSHLNPHSTYLVELIYPENKIVINYGSERLVLLSAYDYDGTEYSTSDLDAVAQAIGFDRPKRYEYNSITEILSILKELPSSEEGFVLRFQNGYRVKLKGDAYCQIHRMISQCTPLSVWEFMMNGGDTQQFRKELPEEFWADFDAITSIINSKIHNIVDRVQEIYQRTKNLSDRDLGMSLNDYDPEVRQFIWPMRKFGNLLEGKARSGVFKLIRPAGNFLDGYKSSSAMNRFATETT